MKEYYSADMSKSKPRLELENQLYARSEDIGLVLPGFLRLVNISTLACFPSKECTSLQTSEPTRVISP